MSNQRREAEDRTFRVRPTTTEAAPAWLRPLGVATVALVVVLLIAAAVAWGQDRGDAYPGYRSAQSAGDVATRIEPPTNAELDGFEQDGPLGAVGPWPWRSVQGAAWRASGGVAQAGAGGGVAVVDPGTPAVIVQVDVFRPVAGAGLVFRWQDAANHFSVEVSPAGNAWLLVSTVAGVRTELGRARVDPQGSDVRLTLARDDILLAVNGQLQVEDRDDTALADATAVGLRSPTQETRYDQFAVLRR